MLLISEEHANHTHGVVPISSHIYQYNHTWLAPHGRYASLPGGGGSPFASRATFLLCDCLSLWRRYKDASNYLIKASYVRSLHSVIMPCPTL